MTALSAIPNELLLEISLYLDYPNLNALIRVGRHFHALLNMVLYGAIAKDPPRKVISWIAENGKEASARKMLQMCGSTILDELVFEEREPIVIAAANGHARIVELFLPHCIQHESRKEGNLFKRALIEGIPEEHVAVVQLLLKHKGYFKTDSQDRHAAIPLCRAVEMGHVSIVKLFLEHNYCNLDTYDMYGMTPLSLAAAARPSSTNLEIAQLLIEAGADLHIDQRLLLRAAKSDNLPVMKLFLANNLDWRGLESFDVLCEFSRPRRYNRGIGALLLSWINVDSILNFSNVQRCLLLRGAIANGLDALIEKILNEWPVLAEDHRASRSAIRFCPLSVAVCYGGPRAVKLLLEHGADPSGDLGISPVQFALEKKKYAIARLLFDKGATLDPEGCRGSCEYRQLLKLRMTLVQGWTVI